MADIKSIDIRDNEIIIHLSLSKHEYTQVAQETENLLVLPSSTSSLDLELTTGTLGNGNRIMFPTRLLKKHDMKYLPKKVAANIFYLTKDKYLLIKLDDSKPGIPTFPEDIVWQK